MELGFLDGRAGRGDLPGRPASIDGLTRPSPSPAVDWTDDERTERTETAAEPVHVRPRACASRLARMGTRSQPRNPVLEPLFRAVRANHPKADLALLERAYITAETRCTAPRCARAATPTSPTRSR